jgi:hypothetical protein
VKEWLTCWNILTEAKHQAALSPACLECSYIQLPINGQLRAARAHSHGNNATQRLKPLRSVSINEQKKTTENVEIKQGVAG